MYKRQIICRYIKKDNYSEPQKYEVRISINKGCRDGTYAGHGAGNMQLKSNGKDAVVTGGENMSDKTIRAAGNRVYVVGNSGFSMDFLLSSDMDMTAGSSNLQIDISDIDVYKRQSIYLLDNGMLILQQGCLRNYQERQTHENKQEYECCQGK